MPVVVKESEMLKKLQSLQNLDANYGSFPFAFFQSSSQSQQAQQSSGKVSGQFLNQAAFFRARYINNHFLWQ